MPRARKTMPAAPETDVEKNLREATEAMPAPAALDTLCAAFGLSPFERDVLLLCAGMELDSAFPALCAAAQGHRARLPDFRPGAGGAAGRALERAHAQPRRCAAGVSSRSARATR